MKTLSLAILENKNLAPLPGSIEGGALPALVSGLGPVHRAHLAAALRLKTGRPLIVVSPDDTAAESMAADLRSFLGQEVEVVGSRDYTFYSSESVSRPAEQRRLRALDGLGEGRVTSAVFTAPALLQRTIPPTGVSRAAFTLRRGQTAAPEDVIDGLLRAGYRSAEQVEGPGQFAHRGGILDIWSTGADAPTRLDFFGDELDTIHAFDASSQRRTDELESIRVLPGAESLPALAEGGVNTLIAALKGIYARLNRSAVRFDAEKLRENLRKDIEALENGTELTAADRYMSLIFPEMATALDYIPGDALVILDQPGKCAERAGSSLKQAAEDIRLLIEGGTLVGRLSEFWLSWEEAVRRLDDFPVVMADAFTVGRYPVEPRTTTAVTAKQLPSYAGSADAAAADVKHWQSEGYRCVVLASDRRRAEALRQMLGDRGAQDVYLDEQLARLPEPGRCAVTVGSISAGMEYPQCRLAVIADTQIVRSGFRRPRRKRALPAGARIGSYEDMSVGDLVVHETHGIGRFAGIFKMPVDGAEKDYIKICYAGTDSLYIPATQLDMVTKYIGAGEGIGKGSLYFIRIRDLGHFLLDPVQALSALIDGALAVAHNHVLVAR